MINLFEVSNTNLKKPKDEFNRYVAWIFCFQEPGLFYKGQWIDFSQQSLEKIVREYKRMCKNGYKAPLIAQHKSEKGERLGDILEIKTDFIDKKLMILAAVAFNDPQAEEKIKNQTIKYFSPSIETICAEDGTEYTTITELSQVDRPYQKNAKTHVLASETKNNNNMGVKMTEEEKKALMDELKAMVAEMIAASKVEMEDAVEEAVEEVPVEEEKKEDEAVEMAEVKKLKSEIEALRIKAFKAENPKLAKFSDESVKSIFGMNEKARNEILKNLGAVSTSNTRKVGTELIEQPSTNKVVDFNSCLSRCNGDAKAAMALYKKLRGV